MGAAVLCAGKARFTQLPTVFFPATQEDYRRQAEAFLNTGNVLVPGAFQRNARRFLYYQLFKTSLPFDALLEEDGVWNGYVRFKDLRAADFDPANSLALRTVVDGILNGGDFLLPEK